MATHPHQAELRLVTEKHTRPLLASTTPVVPLLWLGLFDYDDTGVERDDSLVILGAETTVIQARQRARDLLAALPQQQAQLCQAAGLQVDLLDAASAGGRLVLEAGQVLAGLPPGECQAQVQRLVNLCDLLERLRRGLPWSVVRGHLARLEVDAAVLEQQARDGAPDGLVGQPVANTRSLQDYLVRRGQGRDDLQPEALAAGNKGLLLGRFGGEWKLMSSGSGHDLRGIWGKHQTAFIVGGPGGVLRLDQGRCSPMEVPTEAALNAVWGLSSRMVCVVGDGGTVLMFTGRSWQPWVVPSDSDLQAITGSGPESICIAGKESAVLSFDGYSWDRLGLPEESRANRLCSVDGVTLAAGRSRYGGELFRKQQEAFVQDKTLPTATSLEGIWGGWGGSFGVVPASGATLFHDARGWSSEDLPVDRIHAVDAGAEVLAVGRSGSYSVVLNRAESGWQVEASLRGQRLNAIWVAGNPRPPRLGDLTSEEQPG